VVILPLSPARIRRCCTWQASAAGYIVGGGRNAARLVGIDVDRVSMVAYVLSGIFAAIAGLVLCGYSGVWTSWVARTMSSTRSSPR